MYVEGVDVMRLRIDNPYLLIVLFISVIGVLGTSCNTSTTDSNRNADSDISTTTSDSDTTSQIREKTLISPVYTIDKKYKSMKGPYSVETFRLGYTKDDKVPVGESINEEIVWIVGISADVISEDGNETLPDEFMCHANLDFTSQRQHKLFRNRTRGAYNRIVTLSQGQTDIQLPEGFGIPMLSTTPIQLTTQVLNHNEIENLPINVCQKVTIKYIKDKDLTEPLTPLYRQEGAYSLVSMTGQPAIFDVESPHESHEGSSCMPGENAGTDIYKDRFGRLFSGHWVVKPGKDVTHTVITEKMRLPYDTDIHAIGVHLHPFAESISLKNVTTGEVVYESRPTQASNGIGLDYVPYYSDKDKSIPLYKDHEYEIISVYNNTSSKDQDAMAVLGIYAIDHDFNPFPSLKNYR